MSTLVIYGDKLSLPVTRELKQLVNITVAAGKFILLHPHYRLIRVALKLDILEDERLEDFEIHNSQFETGEIITYDRDEVFFFYSLLDITCRLFVCEIGDDLRRMAIESGETSEDEFLRVRGFFLRQAQEFLQSMHESFEGDEEFNHLKSCIDQLNELT